MSAVTVPEWEHSADPGGAHASHRCVLEHTGLTVLNGSADVLATSEDWRLLITDDVGAGPTLADLLLLGDGRTRAAASDWTEAFAALPAASVRRAAEIGGRLGRAGSGDRTQMVLRVGLTRLATFVGADPDGPGLRADLTQVARVLAPEWDDGTVATVRLGEERAGLDEAVLADHGWQPVDLGRALADHRTLDPEYLVLPFATRRCVVAPVAAPRAVAPERFSTALSLLPHVSVDVPDWRRSVDLACAGWLVAMHAWLLGTVDAQWPRIGSTGHASLVARRLLLAHWQWGARQLPPVAPAVADLCARALVRAEREWGLVRAEREWVAPSLALA